MRSLARQIASQFTMASAVSIHGRASRCRRQPLRALESGERCDTALTSAAVRTLPIEMPKISGPTTAARSASIQLRVERVHARDHGHAARRELRQETRRRSRARSPSPRRARSLPCRARSASGVEAERLREHVGFVAGHEQQTAEDRHRAFSSGYAQHELAEMARRFHRAMRVRGLLERIHAVNQRRDRAGREVRQHVACERVDDRGLLLRWSAAAAPSPGCSVAARAAGRCRARLCARP